MIELIQSESSFDPYATHSGSKATGFIQITPGSASDLGITTDDLIKMTPIEQLDYVGKHLKTVKGYSLAQDAELSAGDLYSLVLLPGLADREILCQASDTNTDIFYNSNAGLDIDQNGDISKSDLNIRMQQKFEEFCSANGVTP